MQRLMPIPGFPNYKITDSGRVWSECVWRRYHNSAGRWLTPCPDTGGYLRVNLCRDGKQHPCMVHRLVLETFVGPCPKGMEACHNNGIETDNRLTNLRWDTRSANRKDAVRHGTCSLLGNNIPRAIGATHGMAKLTETGVRGINALYRTGLFTQREIAKRYGIHRATVDAIIHRRNWKHLW